jgi:ABC-type uncharacterized transport system permease subunit
MFRIIFQFLFGWLGEPGSVATFISTRTLSNSIPLTIGTLGESVTERSGNLNLGVEGMMSVGAIAAYGFFDATASTGLGLIMAMVCGILISLIHGFATITLRANQTISGLAITMLGVGLMTLIGKGYLGNPLPQAAQKYKAGSGILSFIETTNSWVSMDSLFVLTLVLVAGIHILLNHTRFGISLRSVGENPKALPGPGNCREPPALSGCGHRWSHERPGRGLHSLSRE